MKKYLLSTFFLVLSFTGRTQEGTIKEAAKAFIEHLKNARYTEAESSIDSSVIHMLNAKVLENAWNTITRQFGVLKTGEAQVTKTGTYYLAIIPLLETSLPLEYKLTFKENVKLVGFNLSPIQKKSLYKDPVYAQSGNYRMEDIKISSGTFELPGVLTLPVTEGPFPVVVFIHGSGPADKDNQVGGSKMFRDLAIGLAQKGIATIRYDKRTKVYGGRSKRENVPFTVRDETEDDALAAIEFASKVKGADGTRLYALGHSLGGMLLPRIAERSASLKGIMIAAAPARPLQDISMEQNELLFSQKPNKTAADTLQLKTVMATLKATRFTSLEGRDPDSATVYGPASYVVDLNNYYPLQTVKRFPGEVLILQGERDFQVGMKDLELWRETLKENKQAKSTTFSGLNHLFVPAGQTNTIADYDGANNVPPEVIEAISSWILKK